MAGNDDVTPIPPREIVLTTEQKAIPRDFWTADRISALRDAYASEIVDERAMAIVGLCDEMLLLRRDLVVHTAPCAQALRMLVTAWRAYGAARCASTPADRPMCEALPPWWIPMGSRLREGALVERDVESMEIIELALARVQEGRSP